jgi:hypothetical protein
MNSYNDSKIFCHTVGTNRAFAQIKLKPNNIKSTDSSTNKEEFVNEKSIAPSVIGIIL